MSAKAARLRHLTSINDLTVEEIETIFSAADRYLAELGDRAMFTLVLVLVAIVSKAIGCGVFARLFGFTTRESVRVGAGMISREIGRAHV